MGHLHFRPMVRALTPGREIVILLLPKKMPNPSGYSALWADLFSITLGDGISLCMK